MGEYASRARRRQWAKIGRMTQDPTTELLLYWFGSTETGRTAAPRMDLWFGGGSELDAEFQRRFGAAHAAATRGELDPICAHPDGLLAWVILIDQGSRQLYRGRARAFAWDHLALARAGAAVERGQDREYGLFQRAFLYLPFEHSEDLEVQERSVQLFTRLVQDAPPEHRAVAEQMLDYARQHHALIERFGRFPHRNDDLARTTTAEEFAWMRSPGGGFGKLPPSAG